MSLPNLSALRLAAHDTAPIAAGKIPKSSKSKAAPKTPYSQKPPPEYVAIELREFPSDKLGPPVTVQTDTEVFALVSPSCDSSSSSSCAQQKKTKSTESERAWLREHYGNDWSKAFPETRAKMAEQARRELALKFQPIVAAALAQLRASETDVFKAEHYNEQGLPKLDWRAEVVPALRAAYPNGWTKDDDNQLLSDAAKNARSDKVKAELRGPKETALQAQLITILVQKQRALVASLLEELGHPKTKNQRKAKALCRHWFNRRGTDGKMRVWHSHTSHTSQTKGAGAAGASDVTKEMQDKRFQWAETVVAQPTYNSSNPPQPPGELYLALDVKPTDASYLPDGVDEISDRGGQWLWRYMRALENANFEDSSNSSNSSTPTLTNSAIASIDDAVQYWQIEFRDAQKTRLQTAYKVCTKPQTPHKKTHKSHKFHKSHKSPQIPQIPTNSLKSPQIPQIPQIPQTPQTPKAGVYRIGRRDERHSKGQKRRL